jgi:hypothetical protein
MQTLEDVVGSLVNIVILPHVDATNDASSSSTAKV